jgi:hypothetical protein
MARLRAEMRAAAARRDLGWAAGMLWLSGLIWLAQTGQYGWFGVVQMLAAIVLFLRQRFGARIE